MPATKKVIELIREMMTANPPGGGGAFGSQPPKEGVDGIDTLMPGLRRRKNGRVDFRKVRKQFKCWVKDLDNK
jgi:hypothetical protein